MTIMIMLVGAWNLFFFFFFFFCVSLFFKFCRQSVDFYFSHYQNDCTVVANFSFYYIFFFTLIIYISTSTTPHTPSTQFFFLFFFFFCLTLLIANIWTFLSTSQQVPDVQIYMIYIHTSFWCIHATNSLQFRCSNVRVKNDDLNPIGFNVHDSPTL